MTPDLVFAIFPFGSMAYTSYAATPSMSGAGSAAKCSQPIKPSKASALHDNMFAHYGEVFVPSHVLQAWQSEAHSFNQDCDAMKKFGSNWYTPEKKVRKKRISISDIPPAKKYKGSSKNHDPKSRKAEDDHDAHMLIENLSSLLDGDTGPPDNAQEIQSLIQVLWGGNQFDVNASDSIGRGQARLANMLAEIRWVRDSFNTAGKPAADTKFTKNEVTKIYDAYCDSMRWISVDVRHYLLDDWWIKTRFDEYCFKRFGCKALFFHFLKIGTRNISIQHLLREWHTIAKSAE